MTKYSLHDKQEEKQEETPAYSVEETIIQGNETINAQDLPRGIKAIRDDGTADLNTDYLEECNVFIAIPCFGGLVTDQTLLGVMRLMQIFAKFKINASINTLRNESLVPRARNNLTAVFLENKSFTHMFFIDADIEFEPESVIRMLALDRDIIAGAYPKKTINWDQVRRAYDAGKTGNLAVYGAEYAINFKLNEQKQVRTLAGAIEVLDASTGFMLIKREVFDRMIEAYPETKYVNDSAIAAELHDYCYALWDTMIDPDTRRYLSEDYTFCRRFQKIGGEIWVDPYTKLNHVGTHVFEGDLRTILQLPS